MTHVLKLSDITPTFRTDEIFVIIGENSKMILFCCTYFQIDNYCAVLKRPNIILESCNKIQFLMN
jgi:hypothetical protein